MAEQEKEQYRAKGHGQLQVAPGQNSYRRKVLAARSARHAHWGLLLHLCPPFSPRVQALYLGCHHRR
jgi:hypothetical protein